MDPLVLYVLLLVAAALVAVYAAGRIHGERDGYLAAIDGVTASLTGVLRQAPAFSGDAVARDVRTALADQRLVQP